MKVDRASMAVSLRRVNRCSIIVDRVCLASPSRHDSAMAAESGSSKAAVALRPVRSSSARMAGMPVDHGCADRCAAGPSRRRAAAAPGGLLHVDAVRAKWNGTPPASGGGGSTSGPCSFQAWLDARKRTSRQYRRGRCVAILSTAGWPETRNQKSETRTGRMPRSRGDSGHSGFFLVSGFRPRFIASPTRHLLPLRAVLSSRNHAEGPHPRRRLRRLPPTSVVSKQLLPVTTTMFITR